MAVQSITKSIKGSCRLGLLSVFNQSQHGGFDARSRPQSDPSHRVPEAFYHDVDYGSTTSEAGWGPLISQRLRPVSSAGGGLLPVVNTHLGAPFCTFAYGGIGIAEVSPYFSLIKGPDKTTTIFKDTYKPNFTSTNEASPSISIRNDDTPVGLYGNQSPYIPAGYMSIFDTLGTSKPVALKTYNIWCNVKENRRGNYIKNLGLNDISPYVQVPGEDEMSLLISGNCTLKRIFPISKDLAYETDSKLIYPQDSLFEVSYRDILATGKENCGFVLQFTHTNPAVNRVSNLNSSTSGSLIIEWGDDDYRSKTNWNFTSRFRLVLTTNSSPELLYFCQRRKRWLNYKIRGPIFAQSDQPGAYDVYVHYVGPIMLIGFTPNVEEWNTFVAPRTRSTTENVETYYPPFISKSSTVQVTFQHITCRMKYGPIAFNNFHVENNDLDNLKTLAPQATDLGFVRFDLLRSKLDKITESNWLTKIQKKTIQHRTLSMSEADDDAVRDRSATIYGDWRTNNGKEITIVGQKETLLENYRLRGYALYETTIEGPMFFHVFDEKSKRNIRPLVQMIPNLDLSEHMTSWNVSFTCENTNSSLVKGTATVTFIDLGISEFGAKILALLQENVTVLRLGGGFDSPMTYFEGVVIQMAETEYANGHTEHHITLEEVGYHLLSRSLIPQTFFYNGMKKRDIIRHAMTSVGLNDYLVIEDEESIITEELQLLTTALNRRIAPSSTHSALNAPQMRFSINDNVLEVLKRTLEITVGENMLPVLYYDCSDENDRKFVITQRFGDKALDEFYMWYYQDDIGTELMPSASPTAQHGFITDKVYKSYNTDIIYSDFLVQGATLYGGPYAAYRNRLAARSQETIDEIIASLSNLDTELRTDIGYVGFKKYIYVLNKQGALQDAESIEQWADEVYKAHKVAYHTVSADINVTSPIKHWGRFKYKTLLPEGDRISEGYFYKRVNYDYSKDRGTLTANIEGEIFPTLSRSTLGGGSGNIA